MPLQPPTSNLQPPIIALSTMWSQGRFPRDGAQGDDMDLFAQTAARLGFPYIEINYVIPPEGVEQLLSSDHVAVASLHSPTPRSKTPDSLPAPWRGRWSDALNLASADPDERALAVQRACATIDYAVRAGARYVVLHLGAIESAPGAGDKMFEEERQLRRLYDQGVLPDGRPSGREGDEVEALRRRALLRRREGARRHFPEARRSLAEIADYAAQRQVAVGLENRFHYHEFPSVDEMHELLADYPADLVGFWLDVGHAEILDRLGLVDRRRWLDELAGRCLGAHVHDVDGLADHRPPGRGTADWEHYAAKLPPHVPRVFEINQKTPEDQVAASISFLRQRGVLV